MATDGKTTIGAEVSQDLKRRVRIAAAREDKTISEFLRDTLDEQTQGVE